MKIIFSQKILNEDGEEPKNFSVRTRRVAKTESAIGAGNALVFDRGNSSATANFELERAHKNRADADKFALTHAAEIEKLAPANLVFEIPENCARVVFADTAISEIKTAINGNITNTKYEFKAKKALYE